MKPCKPTGLARSLLSVAEHLVAPRRCLGCGRSLQEELLTGSAPSILCRECRSSLPELAEPLCARCGRALISEERLCLRCRESESSLERIRALYVYRDGARMVVGALKEAGDLLAARSIAEEIVRRDLLSPSSTLLVPIPPSRKGERRRGFDHALLLSRALSRVTGIPYTRLLRRRGGGEQKRLDREGRLDNMRGTLYLRRFRRGKLAGGEGGEEVTLVDDVATTGATLEAAADLLTAAGVRRVGAVVVALD